MSIIQFPTDIVEFYEPHRGFSGAVIPLPHRMKDLADSINGRRLSLSGAVLEFQAITDGIIRSRNGMITLELKRGHMIHHWGVIRYRS